MIRLHEVALSGNCHKVRMLLSILGLPYESVAVDLAGGEHQTPAYLALNPYGQVPALVDGDAVIRDSQAILVYLASRYGGERWWPQDPVRLARIAGWLSTAANEIAAGPNRLRLHRKWARPIDVPQATAVTNLTLQVIDGALAHARWLTGNEASIADLAVYPYLALSPEGGIDIGSYANILRWLGDVRSLDGYIGMPGMYE
ncbi:MAG: glutathione S-transferase family protein [Pseudomonadota bacterium]